jgi:hypothetical protein
MRLANSGRRSSSAPALPMPYGALETAGLRLRRGQTSLTVAASGVGKTQLWGNLAQRMGVPTTYWSADTDQHDVTTRSLALWSGYTVSEVDENRWNPAFQETWNNAFQRSRHIEWVFDTPIKPKAMGERLLAFAEKEGQFPHLLVVDNMSNTVNSGDELADQKSFMTEVQVLARQMNTHIAMLSHAKGEYESGTRPIPKNGALNNLFKLPEIGLTIYRHDDDTLGLNCVKNRGGPSDPAAKHPILLPVDLSRATVMGFR